MKKKNECTKLDERWDGPFEINKVHVNGSVTINFRDGATKRLNIRTIKLYKPPTSDP